MRTILFAMIAVLSMFGGCTSPCCDHIGMPDLFHPGHIDAQREKMTRFNPYANVGAGPNIEGDRPEGFAIPGAPEQRFDGYPKGTTGFP